MLPVTRPLHCSGCYLVRLVLVFSPLYLASVQLMETLQTGHIIASESQMAILHVLIVDVCIEYVAGLCDLYLMNDATARAQQLVHALWPGAIAIGYCLGCDSCCLERLWAYSGRSLSTLRWVSHARRAETRFGRKGPASQVIIRSISYPGCAA